MSSTSSNFAAHVLATIHCTELRARLAVNEVETMVVALGAGFIDPETALAHLHEVGALDLIIPSSVPSP